MPPHCSGEKAIYSALFTALETAVEDGVFPGCVALVWRSGHIVYHQAHGKLASAVQTQDLLRANRRETIYDLASLTKVLATTTLTALAVAEARISLDSPVPQPWATACPHASLGDLLCHCAGLPAHREFFRQSLPGQKESVFTQLWQTEPEYRVGEKTVYSDLGFMILGAWLERIFMRSLTELVEERITGPLGLRGEEVPRLGFRSHQFQQVLNQVAPTEVYDPMYWQHGNEPSWYNLRKHSSYAHYEVHDDNAYAMGGVAGHAGLFGDAMAVFAVAHAWLACELPGLDRKTRDLFWQNSRVPGSTRKLGWDGGQVLSPNSVGHLGFTGTSVWIDPGHEEQAASGRIAILLTNRVHPSRFNLKIGPFRNHFHRLAAQI